MRVLFLVMLTLAGCATPAGHTPQEPSGNVNAGPARGHDRASPTPGAAPQQAEPQLTDLPEPPQRVKGWFDISGRGRDDTALYQDSAACQADYKQAVVTARKLYPEPVADETCQDCGTRNAKAIILRQQNVRNYADAAYADCMAARGWRKK